MVRWSLPTLFNTGFTGHNDIIIKVCVKNVVLARFIASFCFMVVEESNPYNNLKSVPTCFNKK